MSEPLTISVYLVPCGEAMSRDSEATATLTLDGEAMDELHVLLAKQIDRCLGREGIEVPAGSRVWGSLHPSGWRDFIVSHLSLTSPPNDGKPRHQAYMVLGEDGDADALDESGDRAHWLPATQRDFLFIADDQVMGSVQQTRNGGHWLPFVRAWRLIGEPMERIPRTFKTRVSAMLCVENAWRVSLSQSGDDIPF